jgi:hypothetical protein
MAYRPPSFILRTKIWTGVVTSPTSIPPGLPRLASQPFQWDPVKTFSTVNSFFYFPKGTDVRFQNVAVAAQHGDVCEFPIGSGNAYYIQYIWDVGRGFSNEYRRALVTPILQLVTVPLP